jgi:carbon-monoxide dehydrogenase medium subunit
MITEIWFPQPAPRAALTEFAQRQGDFAIVAAAVSTQVTDGTCRAVRVVLGGVGTRPLLLDTEELAGAPAGAATWQAAGELAAAAIDPPSDGHASGDYRKRLAATLVTRALTESTIGATGG